MPDPQTITLLHVSDMQFGRNHRFGTLAAGDPEADFDALYTRLAEDLKRLTRTQALRPRVIIVSGDLAEWGLASEFKDAFEFLDRLATGLDIPRRNVVVVPGNHDVNRKLCESYFSECDGEEKEPVAPYARKWEPYRKHFDEFFMGEGVEFTVAHPWSMWHLDELRLVVAGLNSTMHESHRDEDHYGWVGERQLQWFEEQLEPYVERGWLRIGVVHHNVCRGAMDDDENLRDANDLQTRLGSVVNLLLHGHTHEGKTAWLHRTLPVLSTGSAALNIAARPLEVPNQYQVIRIHPDRVERWARRYQPQKKSWAGDTDASGDGSTWHIVDDVPFEAVHATFGSVPATTHPPRAPSRDEKSHAGRADDFTARVAEICELRHGGEGRRVTVQRLHAQSGHEYLGVHVADNQHVRSFPVAIAPSGVTMELTQTFCETVFEPYYWSLDRSVACEIVYSGERAAEELIDWAGAQNVLLRSFLELQGIIDFRGYVDRQTARLASDVVYPPELYVKQRLLHEIGDARVESDDALAQIFAWLCEPRARFVLLLGDFGTGKTFLLHELARRMPEQIPHLVPVLVELRSLEKAHTLEQLVAQHLAAAGERYIDLAAFPYMLREGRIALLFDGFDELAQRVTYQRATEHFETLMQAAGGNAKVVVTSRTQHFESDRQVKLALAERAEMLPSLSLCRLQPFDGDQIMEFLERRLGDAGEARERLALIEEIRDLLGLSHNPRMLGFIAALPAQQLRDARERTGAITSAELYRLLINEWLEHEAVKIVPRGSAPSLSKNERLTAVTALALGLWSKLERTIHVSELSAELSAVATGLSTGPDGGGLPDRDRLAHLVGSRTLLVRDGEGAFAFVHQSVMEWLVADHAARQLDADRVPEALVQRELTHLMVDFLCDLAGHDRAQAWARAVLDRDEHSFARANALRVLDRLNEHVSGAALAGQQLAGHDLTERDMRGSDLAGADLSEARMARADLRDADLSGATLTRANLAGVRLAGATLDAADARGASLLGADLRGAKLGSANLRRAKLTGARIDPGALSACDTFGAALPDVLAPEPMLASTESPCGAIAFHPSGDLVANGHGSGNVELWDPATGSQLRTLIGHEGWIHAVTFSPDGDTLATAGEDRSVRLWNPAAGELVRTLTVSEAWGVWAVAFSPDGRTLATAGPDRSVRLWDPTTGRPLRTLTGKEYGIWAVAFSPDGHTLATASEDRIIRIWEATTGRQLHALTGHEDRVQAVAFSPDGRTLASASQDVSIRLWDPTTGHELRTLTGHKGGVLAVAFSPDGHTLASAGNDRSARLWDPTTGHELRSLTGHENWVEGVAFSPDGRTLATASRDRSARLWNPMTGRQLQVLTGSKDWVEAVAFSPDGHTLATASGDHSARLWDPATGRELRRLTGHEDEVRGAAFSSDGRTLATASDDRTVRLWDPATGRQLHALSGHEDRVQAVAFSPDGHTLATAGDDLSVRLWEPTTGSELRSLTGHDGGVHAVAFSPDGHTLATASGDHSARLWDPATGRELRRLTGHKGGVHAVAFSPDGHTVATASADHSARLWDATTGHQLHTLAGHEDWVQGVTFSPDGDILATAGGDRTVRLWDPATGRPLRTLTGHENWVHAVAFSPDGHTLATASGDRTVRLWDPTTGAWLAVLAGAPEGWIAYTPDGRYKLGDRVGVDTFWYAMGLCRFTPGELDPFLPEGTLTRLEEDEPLRRPSVSPRAAIKGTGTARRSSASPG